MRSKYLLLLGLLLSGIAVGVSDTPEEFYGKTGFMGHARVGLNLLGTVSNSNSDNVISFLGGAGASYFFIPAVGVFIDGHYCKRGFKKLGLSNMASFIDVPAGIAFNFGRSMFGTNSRTETRLGVFYALPLGDYSGDLFATTKAEKFLGFMIDGGSQFQISESFSLGYSLWVKFGLEDMIKGTGSTYSELGIGVVAGFF